MISKDERIPLSVTSDQLALEAEMAKRGVERYRAVVDKSKTSLTRPGRQLLESEIEVVERELRNWKTRSLQLGGRVPSCPSAAVDLLCLLPNKLIARIALQSVLDSAMTGILRAATVCRIANQLRDEALLLEMRRRHPPLFERLLSFQVPQHMRTSVANLWRKRGLWSYAIPLRPLQVRAAMIAYTYVMNNSSCVFEQNYMTKARKTIVLLRLRPGVQDWIEQSHCTHEALSPVYLPMVQEPRPWSQGSPGGYRTNMARRKPFCSLQRRSHIDEMRSAEMPDVFRAINLAQNTAWRVNSTVLEVARDLWATNQTVGDLPDQEEPDIPARPEGERDDPDVRAWRSMKTDAMERFRSEGSSRMRHLRTLRLAEKFDGKTIWYPYFIDFRGRMYPVPAWLNHQGPDFARGLMEFNDPCQVQYGSPEATAFMAHGEALFKGPIPEGLIQAVHRDPLDCLAWDQADKPWQFLSWALDAAEWLGDEGHFLRTVVSSDGCNNGLQIYALLMRDKELARATNVSPGPKEDLYQLVADRVWAKVQADPSEIAAQWRAFLPDGLPRDATKRPVMASPYGIRKHSSMTYIKLWLLKLQKKRNERPWGHSVFLPCSYLNNIIWDELQGLIKPATRCMDWLREIAGRTESIRWTTPIGLPVRQNYPKQRRVSLLQLKPTGGRMASSFKQNVNETAMNKQRNGLPPNFIHSLDAAVMMKTMLSAEKQGIKDFAMIHDSYGTNAAESVNLSRILRENFVEMFSDNLLEDFIAEVRLYAQDETLPDPPDVGDLDPSVVLNSEHFFS